MGCKKVIYTICVVALLLFVIPIHIDHKLNDDQLKFQDFVMQFNKSYVNNASEFRRRFAAFRESLRSIETLNGRNANDTALYGITRFSDLSKEEFHHKYLRSRKNRLLTATSTRRRRAAPAVMPNKWDWRQLGAITPVRDQLSCGACWAFSTVETMEAMNALKNRSLVALSVQQVVDCAKNGNNGCDGGDSKLLLEWLLASKAKIEKEATYPYNHGFFQCRYKGTEPGVQIESFSCESYIGNEEAIKESLFSHGPVAVAVNAANWQYYLGGVIQYHCSGASADLNHAVQLVGYVNNATPPYFIARNSWGSKFGDGGYIYLSSGTNICGLANEVCKLDVI